MLKNHLVKICACVLALLTLAACTPTDPTDPSGSSGTTGSTTASVPESTGSRMDSTGKYQLSAGGEAIISDVDLSHLAPSDDNNRVFYEIFVGSFSDSNGDGIGDLRGIINRMDYLNDGDPTSGLSLGVEGIWLSPIFKSVSYHKYDVSDYYTIDPAFGTMEDLQELIDLCHQRNVKLILDLVINHTSTMNPLFQNFLKAHRSGDTEDPYYDYYSYYSTGETAPAGRTYAQLSGTTDYYECNFSGSMPELNFDNEAVRQEVLEVAKFYLDMDIDGFRFDAAKYIYFGDNVRSAEFWDWYMAELRAIKPDLYAVAEVWDSDGITIEYFSALNCFNFTTSQSSGLIAETAKAGDVSRYTGYVQSYLESIKAENGDAMMIPFVTNHDMDRAAGFLQVASGQMQMAANLYILTPGSPFLYYGEELGLRGSRGGANTDANRRLAMRWGDGDTVADPEGSTYPDSSQIDSTVADQLGQGDRLLNYYKKLLLIRQANPEIARGEYVPVDLSGKLGGFTATWEGSTVCVLHNTTTRAVTVELSDVGDFSLVCAFIGMDTVTLDGTTLTIGPQTSVVLR